MLREFLTNLRFFMSRKRPVDLDDELQFHLDQGAYRKPLDSNQGRVRQETTLGDLEAQFAGGEAPYVQESCRASSYRRRAS